VPLGIARSVLTTSAAASASGADRGYWKSNGTVASGSNGAGIVLDFGADWSFAGDSTVSVWFKGSTSDMDANANFGASRANDHMALQHYINKGTSDYNLNAYVKGNSDNDKFWQANSAVSNFDDNFLDDEWHNITASIRTSTTSFVAQIYLDGTQYDNATSTASAATTASNVSRYFHLQQGSANSPGSGYENDPDGAHTLAVANYFYDDKFYDLTSNIDKFYDSGVPAMGTDGTGTGLTQPKIYLYANAAGEMVDASGTLTNGGSQSLTITGVREGSGDIVVYTSGGPGA
tara:strand:- start:7078 stop:7947 length:870 start_codon:yes stop_codon:yes gene_type:complete